MDKPVRIMHVGMTANKGGLESYIMSLYRNVDREKVQFDFLTLNGEIIAYQEEIERLGGRVFDIGYRRREVYNHFFKFPFSFFRKHPEIKIIHFHKTSLIDIDYLLLSYFSKVPVRIIHSHSSNNMFKSGKLIKIIEKWNVDNIDKFTTHKLACSDVAGKWLFKNGKYQVVKNSIDIEKFKFNNNYRNSLRKKYSIEDDTFVIGHVGFFTDVKNHMFIIDMFIQLLKKRPNSCLILIGDGQLKKKIEDRVENEEIKDKVVFTGSVDSVNKYLSMMDTFILPSKFEGFPISGIEAQCNGLPSYFSNTITKEIAITDDCHFLSIKNVDVWVEELSKVIIKNSDIRENGATITCEKGYDIVDEAKRMQEFYLDSLGREKE